MSYQKIELVYGQTLSIDEYNAIMKKIKSSMSKADLKEYNDYFNGDFEIIKDMDLAIFHGYYYDDIKIGISLARDEVKPMQDFVFDFHIPDMNEVKRRIEIRRELLESIGLDLDKFTLGVCTKNY